MKVRMRPAPARIKDDLDTIFVAIDRLRTQAWDRRYAMASRTTTEIHTGQSDLNLANRALIALANVRERLANSVPIEQGEMEMGE